MHAVWECDILGDVHVMTMVAIEEDGFEVVKGTDERNVVGKGSAMESEFEESEGSYGTEGGGEFLLYLLWEMDTVIKDPEGTERDIFRQCRDQVGKPCFRVPGAQVKGELLQIGRDCYT